MPDEKAWFEHDPPIDPLPALKAKAQAEQRLFETRRDVLIEAYREAKSPKARLKALATVMQHHAGFIGESLFTADAAHAIEGFARQVRKIAGDL